MRHERVQRDRVRTNSRANAVVLQKNLGTGQQLDHATRAAMESTFDAGFGDVRLHTGPEADAAARSLSARAFTVGTDIGFRAGMYDPHTEKGRGLLAHELAHVIQQRSATRREGIGARKTALEREASGASHAAIDGVRPVGVSQPSVAPAVQCQSDEEEDLPNPQRKKDLPEKGLTERSKRSETARHTSKIGETVGLSKTERHHALPKFLGGKKIQDLVKLPWELHYLYHRELNHLLEREFKRLGKLPKGTTSWKGFGKLFDKLSPDEQEQVLQKVQAHADEFDNRLDKKGRKYSQLYKSKNTLGGQMRKEMKRVRPKVASTRVATGGAKRGRASKTTTRPVETPPTKPQKSPQKKATKPTRRRPARTSVTGSLSGLGLSFGLGLLQNEFAEMMLEDLEKLPKPKIDQRGAEEYLKDPQQAQSMKIIDLFNKELGPFLEKLEEQHTTISWTASFEVLAAGEEDDLETRLELLGGIRDELSIYGSDLDTISDNVDALLELEAEALESAEAADDLVELMRNGLVADYLIRSFGVEGFSRAESNLLHHAAAVRKLFRDARKLRKALDRIVEERDNLDEKISVFQGDAFKQLLHERIEQQKQEREKAQSEAAKKTPRKPKPMRASEPSLWQRGTRALERSRAFRTDPEARPGSGDAELAELFAVASEIDKRSAAGFAHEEEKDVLLRLQREVFQEIGKFMNARSRGDF